MSPRLATRPVLAVCVPTYNRAELVARLLERLREANVPILVSDNASEDGTPAVLARACERSPLVTTHRQPENVGPLENVRWLLTNAPDADYVWCFGDDDTIVPGGVSYARSLLRERRPAWLFLPHVWAGEDGVPVNGSPCPDEVQEFDGAGDLYRAYHHWLTFVSASIVRRDLVEATARHATTNRYAPLVWYFRAGVDGSCVVANRRIVSGSPDIGWTDVAGEIVTSHYLGLYDEAIGSQLTEHEFGQALDGLYVDRSYLEFWRGRPREELVAATRRFPTSRSLCRYLFTLAHDEARPDLYDVVREAVGRSGAAAAARRSFEAGEELAAAGDLAGAAKLFFEAAADDPMLGGVWGRLGAALHGLRDPKADRMLLIALELDPDDRVALVERAQLMLEHGDAAAAARHASRLLALDPGHRAAARVLSSAELAEA